MALSPGTADDGSVHDPISPEDADFILQVRLLIARVANKDSLRWWDDESLTPAASFLLQRLFPVAPGLVGRRLALEAAMARHEAALGEDGTNLHLFRLDADNRDRLALRFRPLLPIHVPQKPVTTMEMLRNQLLEMFELPPTYEVVHHTGDRKLQIEAPPPSEQISQLRHRAQTLAWAYLKGALDEPVFPYLVE